MTNPAPVNPRALRRYLLAALALPWVVSVAQDADPAAPDRSRACDLLANDEVAAVQGHEVVEHLPGLRDNATFSVYQCVFRTADHAHSVSLALATPAGNDGNGAVAYWTKQFGNLDAFEGKKELPPRSIEDLGDQAYWVGDPKTGALYVLSGNQFLRISAGGIIEEKQREKASVELARRALIRLK